MHSVLKFSGIFIFFLFLTIGISYKMLPFLGGISHTDAAYFWNADIRTSNVFSVYSDNYLGIDQSNGMFGIATKTFIIFFFRLMGISHEFISYLLSFGFIFLAGLIGYYVFASISKSGLFGIIAGTVLILNNVSIEYIVYGGMTFHFPGIIAYCILFLIFWKTYNKKMSLLYFSLLAPLASLFIFHAFYFIIFSFLTGVFLIYIFIRRRTTLGNFFLYSFVTFLLLFLLNSYWILPFMGGFFGQVSDTSYGNLSENVLRGFTSIAGHINSLNFFQYGNLFAKEFHHSFFHYVAYIGIVVVLIWLVFFSRRPTDLSSEELDWRFDKIFILIVYLFIFMGTLGPTSPLLGGAWLYAWENFSSFHVFRAFIRFQSVVMPLYLLFFAIFIARRSIQLNKYLMFGLLFAVFLLNIDMFSGDMKGSITPISIPEEYETINNFFDQYHESSIITFPNHNYEAYKWSLSPNRDLILQSFFLKDYLFVKPIVAERASLILSERGPMFSSLFSGEELKNIERYLKVMNIRYILIQKDLVDIYTEKPIDFMFYDRYFHENDNYKLLVSNKLFNLYEFKDWQTVISGDGVDFEKINSSEYEVRISLYPGEEKEITLHRNFSPFWKFFPGNFKKQDFCLNNIPPISLDNSRDCSYKDRIFSHNQWRLFYGSIGIKSVEKNKENFSISWKISSEDIKMYLPKESYQVYDDGRLEVSLILAYTKNTFFFWGCFFSVFFLGICIAYLSYAFLNRKKKRDVKKICDIEE